jgi:hypothetical protein
LSCCLSGCDYFVHLGADCCAVNMYEIPQGSIPGPLFSSCTLNLVGLICSQNLVTFYADDLQLYGSWPGDTMSLASQVDHCIDLVASLMQSNQLCLNSDKTEVPWV